MADYYCPMEILFRQLIDEESHTYSYLVADPETRMAALIDPVVEQHQRDLQIIEDLNLELLYTLDTHVHADHITGADSMRKATGSKVVLGAHAGAEGADMLVEDDAFLLLGKLRIRAISTPGHTDGCTSYVLGDRVFTGDALLIRGTGRTDFQQGSAATLYDSIREKLFLLPPSTLVYPAHDYKGRTATSIEEERRLNPRVRDGISKDQFVEIMDNLDLAPPKKLDESLPANLRCGQGAG